MLKELLVNECIKFNSKMKIDIKIFFRYKKNILTKNTKYSKTLIRVVFTNRAKEFSSEIYYYKSRLAEIWEHKLKR